MKTRRMLAWATGACTAALFGCQTVNDQAPVELQQAKQAIDKAEDANMDDLMPSAFEAAERKFDRSIDLLGEASDYQKSNETTQAESARTEAIRLANEARVIAESGVRLADDMKILDANAGEYVAIGAQAERAAELQGELDATKLQLTQLQGEYEGVVRDNEDLANQPAEVIAEIPADFRVAKPVAYFQSGSTALEARFRPDISELAEMLTKNPDLQVKLEGFADPRGSAALNQRLAEQRLQSVAKELKAQGVADEQVQMVTVGETAENTTGGDSGQLQLDRKVTATVSVMAH